MNDILCRLEAVSTEICLVLVALIGAVALGAESKDLLIAIGGGLTGYLTRKATGP